MKNVTFHTSRTAARTAAKIDGTKFKDFGSMALKGERWATIAIESKAPTLKAAVMPAKRTASKPRTAAKKTAAVALIRELMDGETSRKEIIAELVAKVGLTAPGASTYYANVKNGSWS